MAKALVVRLSETQREELVQVRDHHPKAYIRERAAAVLKISAGQSGRQVALTGLLKVRDPDSIYEWLRRYVAKGIEGLKNRPGRGRKPAFSPSVRDGGRRPAEPVTPAGPQAELFWS